MWWPAIGGLVVGIGGWLDPRVLGVGYDTIHTLLKGELVGAVVIGLLLGRASIMTARLRRHEQEHHREAGWLRAFSQ